MPNHISNKLTLHCDAPTASKVFAEIGGKDEKGEDRQIDFNNLLPYPKAYADADRLRNEWEKANPNKSWNDAPQDGFNNGGYEWCRKNWGTKWNAYSQKRVDDKTIYFETAWSTPIPIFHLISAKFPDVPFTVRYADEDIGSNAGVLQFKSGITGELRLLGTEAAKLYFQLNSDSDPKDYGYDPESFERTDEEAA